MPPQQKTTIRLDDDLDRWRWVCPRGHREWEPTNYHFWCAGCARGHGDADPEFHELRDLATGETLARDEVVLEDSLGSVETVPRGGACRD